MADAVIPRQPLRKLLSLSVLGVLAAATIGYIWLHYQDFAFVTDLNPLFLAALIVVTLGYLLTQCVLLRDSVRPFGVILSPMEWVGLMMVTFFSNYFIPFAGLGARALYLSRRHGLSLTHFSVAMGGVLLVELLVYSVAGMAMLAADAGTRWDSGITVLGLAMIAGGLVLATLVPPTLVPFGGRAGETLRLFLTGWRQMLAHRRTMASLLLWTIVQYACFALMFHLALKAVDADVSLRGAAAIAALTDFAFLIRLAPAAAGSFEVAILFGGQMFGVATAQALVVAALVRAAMIVWFIILGPWFSYRLLR